MVSVGQAGNIAVGHAAGYQDMSRLDMRGRLVFVRQLLLLFVCIGCFQSFALGNLAAGGEAVIVANRTSLPSNKLPMPSDEEPRLLYDDALELRGEAALGSADRWLKGMRTHVREQGSKLPPRLREQLELSSEPMIRGKYEDLKRHEAREVRAGRIARLERELGELSNAKMYEVLSGLNGLSGSLAQRATAVRRILESICPAECDVAQKIDKAVADKAVSQEEAELRKLDFRRRVLDNVVKTLAVSNKGDQASALLEALETDGSALAREFGYSPYDLAVMRKALTDPSDKDEASESLRRDKDGCDANASVVTGTGWFVNSNSVITCFHVIDGSSRLEVVFPSGERAVASVVADDAESDLAVLSAECAMQNMKSLPIRIQEAKIADKVWTVGYPLPSFLGQGLKYSEGVVNSTSGLAGESSRYQISTPVQPGNSGGALMDEEGRVVGIVAAGLNAIRAAISTGSIPQNVNYAVKSGVIAAFLDANGVGYGDCEYDAARDERINKAKEATVLIVASMLKER